MYLSVHRVVRLLSKTYEPLSYTGIVFFILYFILYSFLNRHLKKWSRLFMSHPVASLSPPDSPQWPRIPSVHSSELPPLSSVALDPGGFFITSPCEDLQPPCVPFCTLTFHAPFFLLPSGHQDQVPRAPGRRDLGGVGTAGGIFLVVTVSALLADLTPLKETSPSSIFPEEMPWFTHLQVLISSDLLGH